MSKYLLAKFLFTVDRDPELVERYRADPVGTVDWWETEMANRLLNCHSAERSTWLAFDDEERRALREHDHVALFTATPINRGAADLLQLVGLLGADNFEDATLAILNRLERRRGRDDWLLTSDDAGQLRREIQRFTVRRTKSQLNALVNEDPDNYCHPVTGRVCQSGTCMRALRNVVAAWWTSRTWAGVPHPWEGRCWRKPSESRSPWSRLRRPDSW